MGRNQTHLTLEEHVLMGQTIKDAIKAVRKILEVGSELGALETRDVDRLIATIHRNPAFERLRCRLDDQLFEDCPWLTNEAFSVYYHDDDKADANKLRIDAGRRER